MQRRSVKSLQQIKHRPILVIEQATGQVHPVVGRNTNEILVEGAVMDRTEAEPVTNRRHAGELDVRNDVRCVEEPQLAEAADCTSAVVGRDDTSPKARL